MHFKSLLTVELPEVQEDQEWELEVSRRIEELSKKTTEDPIMPKIYLERLNNIRTAFSRELHSKIVDIMDAYCYETEDLRHLKFEDYTDKFLAEYNDVVNCFKFPNGRIVEDQTYDIWDKFIIRDGLVYQKYAGSMKQPKRTKKAKKMKALVNYPRKKLYKSLEDYVIEVRNGVQDPETGKFGYRFNPNGVWDWYSVGGRWPAMFLVKHSCKEYTTGERSWTNTSVMYPAPEGYIWVCGARKKDIEWNVMRDWLNSRATERFYKLQAMFNAGQLDDTICGELTEDGIIVWGTFVYRKDEALQEFLSEYGIPEEWRYPVSVHDIFDVEGWKSKDSYSTDKAEKHHFQMEWHKVIDDYVDNLDDETVLVGIDYHS